MTTEIDIFVSNYILFDPEIYQLWVEGKSAKDVVIILHQRGLGQNTGASLELISSDVLDHFRNYSLLEKLLTEPSKLQEQSMFQIEPHTLHLIIEQYYEFDDTVIRELIGKKLGSKHRKELDDVADKTGIPLKICRRQFENVKRVIKTVENMPGSVIQNIQKLFYLSEMLARKYACLVFLASIRFEITKKTSKLSNIPFPCYRQCTSAIFDKWSSQLNHGREAFEPGFYKDFFGELARARVIVEKEREHKNKVCVFLKPLLLQKNFADLDSNFRMYTRPFAGLAANITKPRDFKNIFVELNSLTDNLKQAQWSVDEVEAFVNGYTKCSMEFDMLGESETLRNAFDKYMKVITDCLLGMYC